MTMEQYSSVVKELWGQLGLALPWNLCS